MDRIYISMEEMLNAISKYYSLEWDDAENMTEDELLDIEKSSTKYVEWIDSDECVTKIPVDKVTHKEIPML